tara:strand:+ start:900 stop:1106 length:207 start_codon:yes stop_codon:yes gene_type:complete
LPEVEKEKIVCDDCGADYTISWNTEETDQTNPFYCAFCGSEIIMVEEYDNDDDDWDDSDFDDEEEWVE